MSDKKYLSSKEVSERSLNLERFDEAVLKPYLEGRGEHDVVADELAARSLIPPATGAKRDFSAVAPEIPTYNPDKCIACMECVMQCPDAAIHARVSTEEQIAEALEKIEDGPEKDFIKNNFGKPAKFWKLYEKKGKTPGMFSIWIDPTKCKGCGECVAVCSSHGALSMAEKNDELMQNYSKAMEFINDTLPPTSPDFINEKLQTDIFLKEENWLYVGGAGACMGCGEITAYKMALTAAADIVGDNQVIVAATGCNSVYSSTYPWNIFKVPWTNPLFENAATTALGLRVRLNQMGRKDTLVWAVGGDGAMYDIGFQPLSRLLASGENVKVLVLDTQVYSNTGGQASTASFTGQNAKMSYHGRKIAGKTERRKELGTIAMMHPDVFVAQISAAYYNHFLKTVKDAVTYDGPAVIIAYSPCMPEHGIGDDKAFEQAKNAVISRAFPLFVYDPRKGDTIRERLSLAGNPSLDKAWHTDPKTGELQDFVWFAKKEGRFAKHFDKEGNPSDQLLLAKEDRLKNWRQLKELAGLLK